MPGCASSGKKYVTLVSSDRSWTIPQGAKFEGIQTPQFPKLTEFVAPDNLVVLYQGRLLELEKEANVKTLKKVRKAKKQGALIGGIGSLFAFLGGLMAWLNKRKKKK